jgi:hypothetical protein
VAAELSLVTFGFDAFAMPSTQARMTRMRRLHAIKRHTRSCTASCQSEDRLFRSLLLRRVDVPAPEVLESDVHRRIAGSPAAFGSRRKWPGLHSCRRVHIVILDADSECTPKRTARPTATCMSNSCIIPHPMIQNHVP